MALVGSDGGNSCSPQDFLQALGGYSAGHKTHHAGSQNRTRGSIQATTTSTATVTATTRAATTTTTP